MSKMKEEFIRLHEIEMLNIPPFLWNGEVECLDFPDEKIISTEEITLEGLDVLFSIDEDE